MKFMDTDVTIWHKKTQKVLFVQVISKNAYMIFIQISTLNEVLLRLKGIVKILSLYFFLKMF